LLFLGCFVLFGLSFSFCLVSGTVFLPRQAVARLGIWGCIAALLEYNSEVSKKEKEKVNTMQWRHDKQAHRNEHKARLSFLIKGARQSINDI
jgi:hypothetical protein